MTKDQLDELVNRFLGWKLPADFAPDSGIKFKPPKPLEWWPAGTNLFTSEQARAMLEHVLGAQPSQPPEQRIYPYGTLMDAEIARVAAEQDAARMQWLHDKCSVNVYYKDATGKTAIIVAPMDIRAAIDSAMEKT